ncbi:MAG: NADH-quinone oxidoreductase subunit N [Bdellovibrionaceae bacterium]|nr:NADH-quinone oxidoreductase subunit N [Bdellovibrionales bacterium]MCB9085483.1 NADH-quinone oxidoreductase subunit N [Pseudobdellovibrionaceae bacterium]
MDINFSVVDLILVSPAIALFIVSLIPLSLKAFRGNRVPRPMTVILYSYIGLIAAAGLAVANYGVNQTAFEKALVFDGLSSWSTLLIVVSTAFGLLFAKENLATNTKQFSELVFLILNAAVGMMLVSWANDLIMLFIGIEVMSLCLYLAVALSLEDRLSKEAAFKYFVLGSFASAIFLYGVAFIFGTTGNTYLLELSEIGSELISTNRLFLFGVIMLIVGLCFKVSIFPFHAWTPDVYQGSSTPVTGFMAAGVKVAVFVSFLRVVATQILNGERAEDLVFALEWLAVFTMLAGNIAAILQNNLKRMLAYSSVAHSGYVLVGILAAGVGDLGHLGASGVMFYVLGYAVMTLGSFGIISLFEKSENSELEVADLKGLAVRHPWLALCLAVFLLSLAGIPPTVGFFGKFFLFSAAIKQGFFWLAVWGVLSSAISVYYYLKPIVYMYMSEGEALEAPIGRQFSRLAIFACAFLVIAVGLFANPFYEMIRKSVIGLF